MSVDKMVLVPESLFHQLQRCDQRQHQQEASASKREILAAVKRPAEQELVKTYRFMENVVRDPTKSDQQKASEHVEAMNDFAVLLNRITGTQRGVQNSLDSSPASDAVTEGAVDMMPPTLRKQARQLMQRLRGNGDIISWSPNGEVSIKGERLVGSNIADLVGDVLRSRKQAAPERDRFLKVLATLNAPEELVQNKAALSRYRHIKKGGITIAHRPPGLPIQPENAPTPYDDETWLQPQQQLSAIANKKSFAKATTRKKRIPKVKRLGGTKLVKWKNL